MFLKRLLKRKFLFFFILITLGIVIIFSGTKIFLLFKFLIGNDTVIKLNSDKEYFSLENGMVDEVNFEASVTTNPFCSASCNVRFVDMSNFNVLHHDSVSLKPGKPYKETFGIASNEFGLMRKLYRIEVDCTSEGGGLCHSNRETSHKSLIITVDHELNEQEIIDKENFEIASQNLLNRILLDETQILNFNKIINLIADKVIINDSFDVSTFDSMIKTLDLNENLLINFSSENFYYLNIDELNSVATNLTNLENDLDKINNSLMTTKDEYNLLVDSLITIKDTLSELDNLNLSVENFESAENLIERFNSVIVEFGKLDSIKNKSSLIENYFFNFNDTIGKFEDSENGTIFDKEIFEVPFTKINLSFLSPRMASLNFLELKRQCKVLDLEEDCDFDNEVLVFLHGHAVTKDAPLEYSLEGFSRMQNEFEGLGYLSLGAITLYTSKNVPFGLWKIPVSTSIRSSYYFDLFEEPDNYKVVLTKSENIDTYAVRMKEVFDNIRFRTGNDRINVVAFSMGGLVMRRHLQLFGDEGFGDVILVGTPNFGVVGDVATLCPVVGGEKRECDDLTSGSLFLQKLNRGKVSNKISNIYGTGCDMVGGKGDGIVLEDKAHLPGVENYLINGVCKSKFRPLHLDLLKNEDVHKALIDILV